MTIINCRVHVTNSRLAGVIGCTSWLIDLLHGHTILWLLLASKSGILISTLGILVQSHESTWSCKDKLLISLNFDSKTTLQFLSPKQVLNLEVGTSSKFPRSKKSLILQLKSSVRGFFWAMFTVPRLLAILLILIQGH